MWSEVLEDVLGGSLCLWFYKFTWGCPTRVYRTLRTTRGYPPRVYRTHHWIGRAAVGVVPNNLIIVVVATR